MPTTASSAASVTSALLLLDPREIGVTVRAKRQVSDADQRHRDAAQQRQPGVDEHEHDADADDHHRALDDWTTPQPMK